MKSNTHKISIGGKCFNPLTPGVMGILNITPDSFYSGSRVQTAESVYRAAAKMVEEGVDILDIGAYSSRPGAEDISQEEEIRRLEIALGIIKEKFPSVPISLDTFRPGVALFGIEHYGIDLVNDISGGGSDKKMFDLIAGKSVAYILMHMQGNPQNMQLNPRYKNVVDDLLEWFRIRIKSLEQAGVSEIILDPGFGFGKTMEQNYYLLKKLSSFTSGKYPVLAGLSRKSMIWKLLEINPEESLNATTALNMIALKNGASILRVHDVKEAVETVNLYKALNQSVSD